MAYSVVIETANASLATSYSSGSGSLRFAHRTNTPIELSNTVRMNGIVDVQLKDGKFRSLINPRAKSAPRAINIQEAARAHIRQLRPR
jgi:hypothetical protein